MMTRFRCVDMIEKCRDNGELPLKRMISYF